jgi:hypothetical protein
MLKTGGSRKRKAEISRTNEWNKETERAEGRKIKEMAERRNKEVCNGGGELCSYR